METGNLFKPPSNKSNDTGLSLCLRYLTDSGLFLTLSSRDSDVMTLRLIVFGINWTTGGDHP
ncbi:hypothetical protein INR49_001688 [Caranx melampygus]|nr:hypothetical protein INR49_001688 [Caranx melampygus]